MSKIVNICPTCGKESTSCENTLTLNADGKSVKNCYDFVCADCGTSWSITETFNLAKRTKSYKKTVEVDVDEDVLGDAPAKETLKKSVSSSSSFTNPIDTWSEWERIFGEMFKVASGKDNKVEKVDKTEGVVKEKTEAKVEKTSETSETAYPYNLFDSLDSIWASPFKKRAVKGHPQDQK